MDNIITELNQNDISNRDVWGVVHRLFNYAFTDILDIEESSDVRLVKVIRY